MSRFARFAKYLGFNLLPGFAVLLTQVLLLLLSYFVQVQFPLVANLAVCVFVFLVAGFWCFRRYENQLVVELFSDFRRFFEDFHDFSLEVKGQQDETKPTRWLDFLDPNKLPGNAVQLWKRMVEHAQSILQLWAKHLESRIAHAAGLTSRLTVEDMKDLVTELRWIIGHHYDYVVQEAIELANRVQMSENPTEVNKKFVAYRDRYNNFIYDFNKFLRLLDEKLKITVSNLKTIDKDVEFYGPEKRTS
jgi:hypothetical protein